MRDSVRPEVGVQRTLSAGPRWGLWGWRRGYVDTPDRLAPREDVEDHRHHTLGIGDLRERMLGQIAVDGLLKAEPVDQAADDGKVADGENMVLKGVEVHRA